MGASLAREVIRFVVFCAITVVASKAVLRFAGETSPPSAFDAVGTLMIRAAVAFAAARIVGYV